MENFTPPRNTSTPAVICNTLCDLLFLLLWAKAIRSWLAAIIDALHIRRMQDTNKYGSDVVSVTLSKREGVPRPNLT